MSLTISNQVQLQQAVHSDEPEKKEGLTTKDIFLSIASPIPLTLDEDLGEITEKTFENYDKLIEKCGYAGTRLVGGLPAAAILSIIEHSYKKTFELGQTIKNGLEEAWNWVKGL